MKINIKQVEVLVTPAFNPNLYIKNKQFKRPRFFMDKNTGKYTVERFKKVDAARDEARTFVRRVIKYCRRKNCGIAQFINAVHDRSDWPAHIQARLIAKKTPSSTYAVALSAMVGYEKARKQSITEVLSIKPRVQHDSLGYFVDSVVLQDINDQIDRVYPENICSDAF